MEVTVKETFFKSLRRYLNAKNPFYIYFWTDLYYEIKWIFWALRKYFRIVTRMRPWSYECTLEMMQFQIKSLKKSIENGHECEETRIPKLQKMDRFLELIDNILKDEYHERCEFVYNNTKFVPVEGKPTLYEMVDIDEKIGKRNSAAIKKADKLQKEEWNEMMDILKDGMQGWWD